MQFQAVAGKLAVPRHHSSIVASVPAEELGPAITGSLMEIRSKAATSSAEASWTWRWSRRR